MQTWVGGTLDVESLSCFNPFMPAVLIPVTGSVLGWAIAEAGFSPADVATKLGVPLATVGGWINGAAHPTKGQFDKLTTVLD